MTTTPESTQQLLDSEDYGDRLSGLNKLRQLDPAIAFKMIQPLIEDSHARVRYSAVSQMDTLGGQDLKISLELLRRRLQTDSEMDVRAAAADAIAALKLTEAFDDLLEAYQKNDDWLLRMSIVASLGEMGDPRAFDFLAEALKSDNELIQTAAIGSLGELGDERAVDLLLPYAQHQDWQVRHRVALALSRLGGSQARATLEKLAEDTDKQVAEVAKASLTS